ncbi:hypothetical protein [Arthrobacter sp. B3I4]|uniref:hypothetical protein n=1 Tax=Arthrobacter sp. B3I4 TaxID=3042267 RepID=UPI002785694E|nr:hypothetical protein [Arthrobacter sp. B3I4]MDQ0754091.1 hypothetical protein [Arthrobacter sp. B3I4]
MIAILQWTTLAVCGVLAAARIPSALRGESRLMFGILLLMTLAILLSIQGPYLAIDQALGGINLANLALRFIIFGAILMVGVRVARGFGAQEALRLITGRPGLVALAVTGAAVVLTFLMMDTAGSSAGLEGVFAKDARNASLVEYYGAAGRLYPAYVSLVLLPTMIRVVRGSLPALIRAAAALLSVGAVAIALSLLSPVVPPGMGFLRFIVNYTAVLCYVLGLALIWVAKLRAHALPRRWKSNAAGATPD